MLERIEALRKKPRAVRDQYAFAIAVGVTLCIALIWTLSLPARFTFDEVIVAQDDTAPPAGPTLSEQLSDFRAFIGEGLEEVKTQAEIIGGAVSVDQNGIQSVPPVSPEETAHYDFFPPPATDVSDDIAP